MTSRSAALLVSLCICGFATAEAQESRLAIVDIDGRESADGVTIRYTARSNREWGVSIPFELRLPTLPAGRRSNLSWVFEPDDTTLIRGKIPDPVGANADWVINIPLEPDQAGKVAIRTTVTDSVSGQSDMKVFNLAVSEEVARPILPFLEGTEVFRTNEDDIAFESAIFLHLVLYQNLSDVLDARTDDDAKEWFWAISGTPAVRTRMFTDTSAPIRTPSFMPRVNLQFFRTVDHECPEDGEGADDSSPSGCKPPEPGSRSTTSLWEVHGILGHDSNGQSGCLFDEQARPVEEAGEGVDEPCQPSFAGETKPGTVNKDNGNFSTNYVRVGVNWRKNYMEEIDRGTGLLEASQHFSLGLEYQRQFKTDPDVRPFYADNRVNGTVSWAKKRLFPCGTRFELSGRVSYMHLGAKVPDLPRWVGWFQTTCYLTPKTGWGAFFRIYRGQDYYNLGFLDDITRFQFGVTFNPDGFFRFRPPRRVRH